MRITNATRYATELMVEIARDSGPAPVTVAAVAETRQFSLSFLKSVAMTLARADLLKSRPGRHGGYALSRSPELITLRDIVEALEGPFEIQASEREVLQAVWHELAQDWGCVLSSFTLQELVKRACSEDRSTGGHQPAGAEAEPEE